MAVRLVGVVGSLESLLPVGSAGRPGWISHGNYSLWQDPTTLKAWHI